VKRALFLLLGGCTWGGGTGLDLPFLDVVYECRSADSVLEYCYGGDPGDIEEDLGMTCSPTPRHLGPCVFCCGDDCRARGSNALNGCYCPESE
jgi:hypothetical protein